MIRRATVNDAPVLQRRIYTALTVTEVREGLVEEDQDSVPFVAVDDADTAVGTCTLTRLRHRMQRHRAEIGGFVIVPERRGTGLARVMIDHCATYARNEWDAAILEIQVRGDTPAHQTYLGLGFVEWARLPAGLHDHDAVYDDVRLYRRL